MLQNEGGGGVEPPVMVEGLRLRYPQDGRVVLHGVNMTLQRGEVKMLLGPSGAGKSSLALTLNGLIPHTLDAEIRGRVLVNGVDTQATTLPALTAQVGMLFQDPDAQIATLTVEDEVAFGMENLRLSPSEMPARIVLALAQVGLSGMEAQGTEALSGGQKQRLALASTLAMGAQILVLDEPTANLDPAGTASFFELLAQLKAEGATILIIEHKLDKLVEHVSSIDVLDESGTIAISGPPRDVLEQGRPLLERLGVWMPQVCELANILADCGLALDPYPITVQEAAQDIVTLLEGKPEPAPPVQAAQMSDTPPILQVEALEYTYPTGDAALRGVDLVVREGDFHALVGPNGSGKTTLARHLVGLIRPQHGRILFGGHDTTQIKGSSLNRSIGYVFQNPEHQFVDLSVFDELAFSLRALKLPEGEVRARVEPLLARFGLEGHRNSNPYALSQGQKRRLSVATMLALDPAMLILDEPTFGQDHANAANIMAELCRLNSEGITILCITHDMTLVAEYAKQVSVLLGGEAVFHGRPADLFARPDILRQANLEAPPLYEISTLVRESRPGFPLLSTAAEYKEALCRVSDTFRATATSTD